MKGKIMLKKEEALAAEGFHTNQEIQSHIKVKTACNQSQIDFEQLKRRIQSYILPLLRRLLPNGRLENQEYVALNPTRADKSLGSFRINTSTGKWSDFATGDKGDFIALWAYVRGIKQGEAAKELQAIVGRV